MVDPETGALVLVDPDTGKRIETPEPQQETSAQSEPSIADRILEFFGITRIGEGIEQTSEATEDLNDSLDRGLRRPDRKQDLGASRLGAGKGGEFIGESAEKAEVVLEEAADTGIAVLDTADRIGIVTGVGGVVTHAGKAGGRQLIRQLDDAADLPTPSAGSLKNASGNLDDAAHAARTQPHYPMGAENVPRATSGALRKLDDVPWGTYCRTGCEDEARRIQGAIGGEIHRIEPGLPGARFLGPRGGRWTDWQYHEVVVRDGRAYDVLTGPEGLPVGEYKALWEYADDINFGF